MHSQAISCHRWSSHIHHPGGRFLGSPKGYRCAKRRVTEQQSHADRCREDGQYVQCTSRLYPGGALPLELEQLFEDLFRVDLRRFPLLRRIWRHHFTRCVMASGYYGRWHRQGPTIWPRAPGCATKNITKDIANTPWRIFQNSA